MISLLTPLITLAKYKLQIVYILAYDSLLGINIQNSPLLHVTIEASIPSPISHAHKVKVISEWGYESYNQFFNSILEPLLNYS